jgi:plastocyanin
MRPNGIRLIPAVVALVIGGTVIVAGHARAGNPATGNVLGPGEVTVAMTIHHSRFQPDRIQVAPGTTVRFVVDNQDPINHELIVGDAEVHRRHEQGTEPVHPPRPGEVSIPALSRAETTFVFDDPGSVLYACHLPGHFRYGMSGYVDVVAR